MTFARCVLRLTPRSSANQTVLEVRYGVTPAPGERMQRTGPFGEQTLTVIIDAPHRALVIEATARVDVHAAPVEAPQDSPAWESVRDLAFDSDLMGAEGPASYLFPTARTPLLAPVTDYARASFTPGRPVIEAVDDLMRRMYADFIYDPEATEVYTTVAEAFETRRGVCQDFAHIMISGLRGMGLPAAYVSGYLRTIRRQAGRDWKAPTPPMPGFRCGAGRRAAGSGSTRPTPSSP